MPLPRDVSTTVIHSSSKSRHARRRKLKKSPYPLEVLINTAFKVCDTDKGAKTWHEQGRLIHQTQHPMTGLRTLTITDSDGTLFSKQERFQEASEQETVFVFSDSKTKAEYWQDEFGSWVIEDYQTGEFAVATDFAMLQQQLKAQEYSWLTSPNYIPEGIEVKRKNQVWHCRELAAGRVHTFTKPQAVEKFLDDFEKVPEDNAPPSFWTSSLMALMLLSAHTVGVAQRIMRAPVLTFPNVTKTSEPETCPAHTSETQASSTPATAMPSSSFLSTSFSSLLQWNIVLSSLSFSTATLATATLMKNAVQSVTPKYGVTSFFRPSVFLSQMGSLLWNVIVPAQALSTAHLRGQSQLQALEAAKFPLGDDALELLLNNVGTKSYISREKIKKEIRNCKNIDELKNYLLKIKASFPYDENINKLSNVQDKKELLELVAALKPAESKSDDSSSATSPQTKATRRAKPDNQSSSKSSEMDVDESDHSTTSVKRLSLPLSPLSQQISKYKKTGKDSKESCEPYVWSKSKLLVRSFSEPRSPTAYKDRGSSLGNKSHKKRERQVLLKKHSRGIVPLTPLENISREQQKIRIVLKRHSHIIDRTGTSDDQQLPTKLLTEKTSLNIGDFHAERIINHLTEKVGNCLYIDTPWGVQVTIYSQQTHNHWTKKLNPIQLLVSVPNYRVIKYSTLVKLLDANPGKDNAYIKQRAQDILSFVTDRTPIIKGVYSSEQRAAAAALAFIISVSEEYRFDGARKLAQNALQNIIDGKGNFKSLLKSFALSQDKGTALARNIRDGLKTPTKEQQTLAEQTLSRSSRHSSSSTTRNEDDEKSSSRPMQSPPSSPLPQNTSSGGREGQPQPKLSLSSSSRPTSSRSTTSEDFKSEPVSEEDYKAYAAEFDLEVQKTDGDGNCFFNAISMQLRDMKKNSPKQLREKCSSFVMDMLAKLDRKEEKVEQSEKDDFYKLVLTIYNTRFTNNGEINKFLKTNEQVTLALIKNNKELRDAIITKYSEKIKNHCGESDDCWWGESDIEGIILSKVLKKQIRIFEISSGQVGTFRTQRFYDKGKISGDEVVFLTAEDPINIFNNGGDNHFEAATKLKPELIHTSSSSSMPSKQSDSPKQTPKANGNNKKSFFMELASFRFGFFKSHQESNGKNMQPAKTSDTEDAIPLARITK